MFDSEDTGMDDSSVNIDYCKRRPSESFSLHFILSQASRNTACSSAGIAANVTITLP